MRRRAGVPCLGPIRVARQQDDLQFAIGDEIEEQLLRCLTSLRIETDQAIIEDNEDCAGSFGYGASYGNLNRKRSLVALPIRQSSCGPLLATIFRYVRNAEAGGEANRTVDSVA